MIDLNYETKSEFYDILNKLVDLKYLDLEDGIYYRKNRNSGITRLVYVTLSIPDSSEDLVREIVGKGNTNVVVSEYNYIVHLPLYNLFEEDLIDRGLNFQIFEGNNYEIFKSNTTVKSKTLSMDNIVELVNTGRESFIVVDTIYYI